LIDETNQLEFHFRKKTIEICNHRFHKILNIDNASIKIEDKNNRSRTHLYNPAMETCLKFENVPSTTNSLKIKQYQETTNWKSCILWQPTVATI
jgi:hypothetical protein